MAWLALNEDGMVLEDGTALGGWIMCRVLALMVSSHASWAMLNPIPTMTRQFVFGRARLQPLVGAYTVPFSQDWA